MALPFAYVTYGLLFLIAILLFLCYRNAKKKVEGFPYDYFIPKLLYNELTGKIPKGAPITSHIFNTLIDIAKQFSKEGLVMFHLSRPFLLIFSEEAIKFFSNEKAAIDKSAEYKYLNEAAGPGILTSNGERWKKHRKMINPAFHIGVLKDKVPLFNEHAMALVKDMEKMVGEPYVDIMDSLKINYFNSLSESVLGVKQSEENREELLKHAHAYDIILSMVVQKIVYPWLRPTFTSFGRKYQRAIDDVQDFLTKVINDMEKQDTSNKLSDNQNLLTVDSECFSTHLKKSFTYILLRQHHNDPSFTFEDLHSEVTTLLATGFETVTISTMWCLFLLALHPEIQETAFNEINSRTDGYVTYEDSCNLTYLEAIIMETLRIYPTIPLFARSLTEDVQFGKYKVHKGTTIGFFSYILHRNPDAYPDPERFMPERFLNSDLRNRWTFIPFSEGARTCIGKKYSLIELKIFLAHILRNFKIRTLDKREDIGLSWTISLKPARPIRMVISPRHTTESCCATTRKV